MDNEKKWLKQIKVKSDRSAAHELISKYYKEIYIFVYKQTPNKEMAMDMTQEIFTSMLQSIDSFDEHKSSFRTWLYKIATYRLVDYYRSKYYKQTQMTEPLKEDIHTASKDFTIELEYKQDVEKVLGIVNTYDSKTQQILRLKLFADYTFVEISDMLGFPESTIKSSYYATINKIRKLMRRDELGEGNI